MSIAGFDPSAGAGLLADIKCFEQHRVYGFGICSSLTVQSDSLFIDVKWLSSAEIIDQIAPLIARFEIHACKIGLIRDVGTLQEVVTYLRSENRDMKLVLDPVLKSSSGFGFHQWDTGILEGVLQQIDLITPNYDELQQMGGSENVRLMAASWASYCPVLLKGGHDPVSPGTDLLFWDDQVLELKPLNEKAAAKHGSGCVLSAAIVANLALGHALPTATGMAKLYTEKFLNSNTGLLGYHHD